MNLNQMHILLADDDEDDCYFFKLALEELSVSAQLTIKHDGAELMNYLSATLETQDFVSLPDVLFLDINMPRKSGMECLSEIKQNQKLKDLPVVMFSTSNSWDTINMLFESGANVYIHKPSDFSQLKQVLHHALPIAAEKNFSKGKSKYILNA